MGNPQHLRWLLEGVEAWNERREAQDFEPDLSDYDLSEIFAQKGRRSILGQIPLRNVNLNRANLENVVLRGAQLSNSRIVDAKLQGADLSGSHLWRADLSRSDLRLTNLSQCDLRLAVLWGTNLWRATLPGVDVRSQLSAVSTTSLTLPPEATDLSNANGLTQQQVTEMRGDSGTRLPFGLRTPLVWPKVDIEVGPEFLEKPSKEPLASAPGKLIFLSYSHSDQLLIKAHVAVLRRSFEPIWWDQDIAGGERWRDQIAEKLDESRAVLTLWTEASVNSDGVREEASFAQKADKLVHALLDDCTIPYGYAETQAIDLRNWDGTDSDPNFRKLVQALKDKLDPPTKQELEERKRAESPVEAKSAGGKIALGDTPLNEAPIIEDQAARAARMA